MWKNILVCNVICGVVVLAYTDKLISKGKWVVERTELCEDYESYPYNIDLRKKKVNRTHDGFYGDLNLLEDITEEGYGIFIDACKKVDGGCKNVATFEDESFCRYIMKHAEENFKKFLKNIGAEEHCPIVKGNYELKDFMFDNTELPEDGLVGFFKATIHLTKNTAEKIACLVLHLYFNENDD